MTDTLPYDQRMEALTIGQVAKRAGVNVETIRYYQRVGLIEEPPRPLQGYRCYPDATVARIRFIKRAQALGFSLREVGELLRLDGMNCDEARQLAEVKHALVQQRIRDLKPISRQLEGLISACRNNPENHGCALIETLSDHDTDEEH